MHLILRDLNVDMAEAWREAFADVSGVDISSGNILERTADAIVSPANSFGYMDGGIDLAYSHFFGWGLETELRKLIIDEHFGELPVGQAVIIPTKHKAIPFLVSAPTMRVPASIPRTVNVYLAFRATLIAVTRHNNGNSNTEIKTLLVPGLGTGIGEVPCARAARQMRVAYRMVVEGHGSRERNVGAIWGEHGELLV